MIKMFIIVGSFLHSLFKQSATHKKLMSLVAISCCVLVQGKLNASTDESFSQLPADEIAWIIPTCFNYSFIGKLNFLIEGCHEDDEQQNCKALYWSDSGNMLIIDNTVISNYLMRFRLLRTTNPESLKRNLRNYGFRSTNNSLSRSKKSRRKKISIYWHPIITKSTIDTYWEVSPKQIRQEIKYKKCEI